MMRERLCRKCDSPLEESKFQCRKCKAWSLSEIIGENEENVIALADVEGEDYDRIETGPWDPCFGGGIVRTGVTLLGGAPGAGKSTLALQLADALCARLDRPVFYLGTEEASKQLKAHANRLRLQHTRLIFTPRNEGLISESLSAILDPNGPRKYSAVICDSLPTFTNGDQNEAKRACRVFKKFAIVLNAPVIIIDHITKEDDFAGTMTLQHDVDTLLTFFPEEDDTRTLQTIKNRYGSTSMKAEDGSNRPLQVRFYMTEHGLIAA